MNNIAVIIPVVQVRHAQTLCTRIVNNTIKPDQLIIVDSSEHGFHLTYDIASLIDIRYHRAAPKRTRPYFVPGMGTNEAWRWGFRELKDNIDIVCVFNDDIIISRYFFEILCKSLERGGRSYGMAIPQTVELIEKVYEVTPKVRISFIPTKKRVGYAFSLRRSVLDKIPPIPEELKIFYGDNWIMTHVRRAGYKIMLMRTNFIYHHKGTTVTALKEKMKAHGDSLGKGVRRKEYDMYLRAMRALEKEEQNG